MSKPNNGVVFGWGAPPMKEQHPILTESDASHFDKDNEALIRLSVRGYLTYAQEKSAMKKIASAVGKEVRSALYKANGEDA